jgi:hypothetical protein
MTMNGEKLVCTTCQGYRLLDRAGQLAQQFNGPAVPLEHLCICTDKTARKERRRVAELSLEDLARRGLATLSTETPAITLDELHDLFAARMLSEALNARQRAKIRTAH